MYQETVLVKNVSTSVWSKAACSSQRGTHAALSSAACVHLGSPGEYFPTRKSVHTCVQLKFGFGRHNFDQAELDMCGGGQQPSLPAGPNDLFSMFPKGRFCTELGTSLVVERRVRLSARANRKSKMEHLVQPRGLVLVGGCQGWCGWGGVPGCLQP